MGSAVELTRGLLRRRLLANDGMVDCEDTLPSEPDGDDAVWLGSHICPRQSHVDVWIECWAQCDVNETDPDEAWFAGWHLSDPASTSALGIVIHYCPLCGIDLDVSVRKEAQ